MRIRAAVVIATLPWLLCEPAGALIQRSIQIDGDFSDWDGVLLSAANSVSDRAIADGDPDRPATSGDDLLRFAFTWDQTNLYLYWKRADKKTDTTKKFTAELAYLDKDLDGRMGPGDLVLLIPIKTGRVAEPCLFRYVPAAGSDPMRGDGQTLPGIAQPSLPATVFAAAEPFVKERVEASVRWADLGVLPGAELAIQASSLFFEGLAWDLASAARVLPQVVEDNAPLLGTGFHSLTLSPGFSVGAKPLSTVDLSHRLSTDGNRSFRTALRFIAERGLRVELWSDPNGDGNPVDGALLAVDANGDGDFLDTGLGDSLAPGADSDGDLLPDTGLLGPGPRSWPFVARMTTPPQGPSPETRTLTISARSTRAPNPSALVVDTVTISRLTLTPSHAWRGVKGERVLFPHVVCNYHESARDVSLVAVSQLGWPVAVLRGGTPVTRITVPPSACQQLEARLDVPQGAALDSQDTVDVLASVESPDASDSARDTLLVSEPLSFWPARSGGGLAGSSVFYAHTLRNSTSVARSFALQAVTSPAGATTFWSDPDGDGLLGDGDPISLTPPLAAHGGELDIIVQVYLPASLRIGDIVTSSLTAADPGLSAAIADLTTVRLTATLSSPYPGPVVGAFPGCGTAHVVSGPLPLVPHRFRWLDPFSSLLAVSAGRLPDAAGIVTDRHDFLPDDPAGRYSIVLEQNDGRGWTPSPSGGTSFDLRRDLRPDSGSITHLSTSLDNYPVSGATLSLLSAVENQSAFPFDGSTLDYVVFQDLDGDQAPTPGEPYMRLDGGSAAWAEGRRTCRASGLPAVWPGGSLLDTNCFDLGPMSFPSTGRWVVMARWSTTCGDTIAVRVMWFNVGCSGAASANAGADRLVCRGASSQLGSGPATPGLSHLWSPADYLDDVRAAEPWASPLQDRNYTMNLLDTSGCVARDDVLVLVAEVPFADAGASRRICSGASTRLGTPAVAGMSYLWDPPTGLDNPSLAQPLATPGATTNYALSVREANTGCESAALVVVEVAPPVVADAGPDRNPPATIGPPVCEPDRRYSWLPVQGLSDPTACQPTASPAVTTIYCLTVEDPVTGCRSAQDCVKVGTGVCPVADAGPDLGAPGTLGPAACDPTLEYFWTPALGLDDPRACNPLASPSQPTVYCLEVRDPSSGCVSIPDCASVSPPACPGLPEAVASLVAVKSTLDVVISWNPALGAGGGYRAYYTPLRSELALPAGSGTLGATAPPGVTQATDPGAVEAPPLREALLHYRVVGVCGDGVTEGP